MDLVSTAVTLNNQGIGVLALEEDSHRAYQLFTRALANIELYLRQGEEPQSLPSDNVSCVEAVTVPGLQDESFHICNQAFYLDPANFLGTAEANMNLIRLASVAVLFNICVACHHYGLTRRDPRQIQRARSCYRLLLQLVQDTKEDEALGLAAANNLAHIHFRLMEEKEEAKELLASLVPRLLAILPIKHAASWWPVPSGACLLRCNSSWSRLLESWRDSTWKQRALLFSFINLPKELQKGVHHSPTRNT